MSDPREAAILQEKAAFAVAALTQQERAEEAERELAECKATLARVRSEQNAPSEAAIEAAARAWCGSEFFAGTGDPDTYDGLSTVEQAAQRHYARAGLRAAYAVDAEARPSAADPATTETEAKPNEPDRA